MDEIQNILVRIVKDYPRCLSDKIMLHGLLADILQSNRREINLIMNAYETRVVDRILKTRDYNLEIAGIKNNFSKSMD